MAAVSGLLVSKGSRHAQQASPSLAHLLLCQAPANGCLDGDSGCRARRLFRRASSLLLAKLRVPEQRTNCHVARAVSIKGYAQEFWLSNSRKHCTAHQARQSHARQHRAAHHATQAPTG